MSGWADEIDDLRCRSLAWLQEARAEAVREQRRWRMRELAVTRVLDERGSVDDTLADTDGVHVRDVRAGVATARALDDLPHIAAAAAAGGLSDAQLAAVVEIADPTTDAEWAERAPRCAPADLARIARARRAPTAAETRRRFEARHLRFWWGRESGMLEGRFALPDLQGAEFESAITQIAERMRPARGQVWERWDRRAADALVALVHRASGDEHTVAAGVVPKVVVNVPTQGPAEVAPGVLLSAEQVAQLRGNASVEAVLVDEHGDVLATARATSALSDRRRRQVVARDGKCRWPGCETRHGLQIHHMVPGSWAGPTVVANLVTVCAPHHRRLVPHGDLALLGNPALPDGIRLERWHDACDRTTGTVRSRAGPAP